MAGYIISLDSSEGLHECFHDGVYGTVLPEPTTYWRTSHEGTFADYASMAPGDNVFFFLDRKIYGVGELVRVGDHCRYLNFPGASEPRSKDYQSTRKALLWDIGPQATSVRWICTFKPSPRFFRHGVDMDDVLSSNPAAFRMLRAFWRLSFIKCDDEENQALIDIILKRNLAESGDNPDLFETQYQSVHNRIGGQVGAGAYSLDAGDIMKACATGDRLKHEMAIEAGLLFQLAAGDGDTVGTFGRWHYLSHQVVASPFKPLEWVDKMDVFGYAAHPLSPRTRVRYLVCEAKKGEAKKQEVDQLMKYVDWVKDEYCHGDYAMISAFLVAHEIPNPVVQHRLEVAKRIYTIGRRPAVTSTWDQLVLVRYRFEAATRKLRFVGL
jgi:hypothetical protein